MPALQPIEVREFDYLVTSNVPREGTHCISEKQFDALEELMLSNDQGDTPLELMHLCTLKGAGKSIQLRNYVGVIQLDDGLQIEILPKIETNPGEEKAILLRMLSFLGADTGFKDFKRAGLQTSKMPLFEIFISMFLDETARLVRTGLLSAYVKIESEEAFIRGKIDFAKEIRKNPAHAERLNLIFDELQLDRAENRLVKTTLRKLQSLSNDASNVRRARQLLGSFENVPISHNVNADLALYVQDRSTRAYELLITWCRIFLKGESFTMFKGDSVAVALLFPMERIFEDYVGKLLKREALRAGVAQRVDLQARGHWLFGRGQVALRPDIVCALKDGTQLVMDTKWKIVSKVGDMSQSDLHQVYAYGQRFKADGEDIQRVVLLYPWHQGVQPGLAKDLQLVSPDGVQVDSFFVDLVNIDQSMSELIGLMTGEGS